MSNEKHFVQKYWKSIVWAIIILALLLVRTVPVKPPKMNVIGFDKIVHAGLFFLLAYVLFLDFKVFFKSQRTLVLIVIGIPLVYGGILELIQLFFVTGRSGEWGDLLADVTGAFICWLWVRKRLNS